jgi:hypothetical protein
MGLIFTSHILVHRGLIILGCRLLIVIFGQNHVTYREQVINESSPTNNGHFHQAKWFMQKKKHKVMKQVYRVKKDG